MLKISQMDRVNNKEILGRKSEGLLLWKSIIKKMERMDKT